MGVGVPVLCALWGLAPNLCPAHQIFPPPNALLRSCVYMVASQLAPGSVYRSDSPPSTGAVRVAATEIATARSCACSRYFGPDRFRFPNHFPDRASPTTSAPRTSSAPAPLISEYGCHCADTVATPACPLTPTEPQSRQPLSAPLCTRGTCLREAEPSVMPHSVVTSTPSSALTPYKKRNFQPC